MPFGVAVKVSSSPADGPGQFLVEARGHPPTADVVQPVLGVQAGNRLAIAGAGDADRDVVARLHGPIDIDERALTTQLGLDSLVDLGLGGRR